VAAVRRNAGLTPYRLGRALFGELRAFVGSARQSDDVTYLVIRRRP
jgi:serine phosphatase RsbU (regulator of sigma subunit)